MRALTPGSAPAAARGPAAGACRGPGRVGAPPRPTARWWVADRSRAASTGRWAGSGGSGPAGRRRAQPGGRWAGVGHTPAAGGQEPSEGPSPTCSRAQRGGGGVGELVEGAAYDSALWGVRMGVGSGARSPAPDAWRALECHTVASHGGKRGSPSPSVSQRLRAACWGWGPHNVLAGTIPAAQEGSSEKSRCGPRAATLLTGEVPPAWGREATGQRGVHDSGLGSRGRRESPSITWESDGG